MFKKAMKYMGAHPGYAAVFNGLLGVGIGIFLTYPYFFPHPVRWGALFLLVGLGGYLYPLVGKK